MLKKKEKEKENNNRFGKPVSIPCVCVWGLDVNLISFCGLGQRFRFAALDGGFKWPSLVLRGFPDHVLPRQKCCEYRVGGKAC